MTPEQELAILRSDFKGAEEALSTQHECRLILMEALCWYADPQNYQAALGIDADDGRRARLALGEAERCLSDNTTPETDQDPSTFTGL